MKKTITITLFLILAFFISGQQNVMAATCGANECSNKGSDWANCGKDGSGNYTMCCKGGGCPSYMCTLAESKGGKSGYWVDNKCNTKADGSGTDIDVSGYACAYCAGGGGGGDDTCDPKCPTGKHCDNGTCVNDTPTAIPTPSCHTYTFQSGSISPNVLFPNADVLVRCGYGADIDCINVKGGGLTNCTYRTYYNGEAVFACKAGSNPGTYTDATCELLKGTKSNCCVNTASASATTRVIGSYTVLSTAAHYEQRMRLPAGDYTLTVRAHTVIYKKDDKNPDSGAYVDLNCANPTCGGSWKENDSIIKVNLPESSDFVTYPQLHVKIPDSGDMHDYKIRIIAGLGSELYVDKVSFYGGKVGDQKEYVLNGDFKNFHNTTVELSQPVGWGDGDNKLGFYYGMAIDAKIPPYTPPCVGNCGGDGGGGGGGSSSSSAPPAGSVDVTLNMKAKLQGVVTKPKIADPIYVKVKIGGGSLSQSTGYQTAKFTVDSNGVWSGDASFKVPPGGKYAVYVKGPKHLQKKICDAAPTETSGGTYHCGQGNITIKSGANAIDLSKILLLVGDLPENGTQNGIVDAYDTGYIRSHLRSTTASELTIGDLNYDGVIDSQDFSLVMASLSIKYDEE